MQAMPVLHLPYGGRRPNNCGAHEGGTVLRASGVDSAETRRPCTRRAERCPSPDIKEET